MTARILRSDSSGKSTTGPPPPDAGVGHHNMESAETLDDRGDERIDCTRVGHVAVGVCRSRPQRVQDACFRLPNIREDDTSALIDQLACDAKSQALRR